MISEQLIKEMETKKVRKSPAATCGGGGHFNVCCCVHAKEDWDPHDNDPYGELDIEEVDEGRLGHALCTTTYGRRPLLYVSVCECTWSSSADDDVVKVGSASMAGRIF